LVKAVLSKNNRVKRLKLTANMSNNDMKIKMMQILEIIKKQSKVMLFMRTSRAFDDEKVTQKMESIKAQLGQRVRIIQDIKVRTEEEEEEGDDQKPQKKKPEEE
jgi:translation initiation factor IF-3